MTFPTNSQTQIQENKYDDKISQIRTDIISTNLNFATTGKNDLWIYLQNRDDRREDRSCTSMRGSNSSRYTSFDFGTLNAIFENRSINHPENDILLDRRCGKYVYEIAIDHVVDGGITGMTGLEVARQCTCHVILRRIQCASPRDAAQSTNFRFASLRKSNAS